MSLQIVSKNPPISYVPWKHKPYTPLRVKVVDVSMVGADKATVNRFVREGDILVFIQNIEQNGRAVLNCTLQTLVPDNLWSCILCNRAYDIKQILICDDPEPAPE